MKYEKQAESIKDALKMENQPVAVKLFKKEEDAQKYLEKSQDNIIHCQAIITSSKGNSFYGTVKEIGCPLAKQVLGLAEIKENVSSGKYFDKVNVTKTQEAGKNLIDNTAVVDEKIEAIGYAPLGEAEFEPDVVAVIAKPKQIYNLIRSQVYEDGKRLESSISGTQSLCADIVADTYTNGKLSISFGCIGSHLATEFGETDVACGIPISKLDEITEALEIVKLPE